MSADAPAPRRPLILAPNGGPIVSRLVSALTLRADFYAAATADTTGTGPAGAVICLIALVRDSPFLYQLSQTEKAWGLGLLLVTALSVIRWFVVGLVALAAARVSRSGGDYRALLRVLAYADAPTMFLALDPWLPSSSHLLYLPDIALNVWTFAATVVALRAATRASLARACALAVPVYLAQRITHLVISQ
jgi:hypothetical protein